MNAQLPIALIVEDDFIIALSAAQIFEKAGYYPIEACSADEAIKVLESGKDVTVVFTDVRMPGSMDGLALAHCVSDRWPPIKLIVTSGHHAIGEGDLPARGLFVAKPYTYHTVAAALSEATSGDPSHARRHDRS